MRSELLLFVDAETTGLPKARGAAPFAARLWPRLVQLGWAIFDEAGNELAAEEHLVRPSGYSIPRAAARLHGITTARARDESGRTGTGRL